MKATAKTGMRRTAYEYFDMLLVLLLLAGTAILALMAIGLWTIGTWIG